ncbi:hypothetical protein [Streptomyces sp. NPDC058394]|uniref:hypothetical protein n=1 Tax=unclassified Streptomyces TaxID=2593676 RepID=UPI0036652F17
MAPTDPRPFAAVDLGASSGRVMVGRVQARTAGAVAGGLSDLRQLLCETQDLRRHAPTGDRRTWERAEARIADGRQAHRQSAADKDEQPRG